MVTAPVGQSHDPCARHFVSAIYPILISLIIPDIGLDCKDFSRRAAGAGEKRLVRGAGSGYTEKRMRTALRMLGCLCGRGRKVGRNLPLPETDGGHEQGKSLQTMACRITDIYICVMLLVFPLFTGIHGYANLTACKYVFFTAACILWLAGLVFCFLRGLRVRFRRDPALGCLVVFLTVNVLSTLLSPYGSAAFLGAARGGGLLTVLLTLATVMGVCLFSGLRKSHAVCLGVSVTLCSVTGILQLLGGNPFGLFPGGLCYYDAYIRFNSEFLGTIGNADLHAAFLSLALPLLLGIYIERGRRWAWFLLPVGMGTLTLFVSGVAGGLLALLAAAAVALPWLLTDGMRARRILIAGAVLTLSLTIALAFGAEYDGTDLQLFFSLRGLPLGMLGLASGLMLCAVPAGRIKRFPAGLIRRLLIVTEILVLVLGLCVIYAAPPESGTLWELSRVLHGDIRDSFGSSRIRIWREVLALISERPLLGGGPDTLALRLDIVFSRYAEASGVTLTAFIDNAHNVYLGLLADTGWLGLLSYLAAMACSLFFRHRAGRAPLALALISCWIQDLFGLGLPITTPLMWILWGLFLSEKTIFAPGRD